MHVHQKAEGELKYLADYILEKKEDIIDNFRRAARENSQLAALSVHSMKEFVNNLPEFITHFAKRLRQEDHQIEKFSRHGVHRWKMNLDLREVLEEWELLYRILSGELNWGADIKPISTEALVNGHQQLSQSIYQGLKQSVYEYYKSQTMEVRAQIADMENTLRENDEEHNMQGYNLRQASHDLGGSVVLIQMSLQQLKKESMSDKAHELVEQLSGSADNLVSMFKNLLALFRLEAGEEKLEVTEFDVAELMQSLNENMKPLAEKRNLELRFNGQKPFLIRSDKLKIRRIAQNLVMNSLKYTNEGYVEINWENQPENFWLLSIKDTGSGLDSTNAAAFSKSENNSSARRARPVHDGADELNLHGEGIGLSIVRRLCQLLKAIVEVETEAGKGTHFRIMFPSDYPEET